MRKLGASVDVQIPVSASRRGRCFDGNRRMCSRLELSGSGQLGREGKILVMCALMLPVLFGVIGLIVDVGMLTEGHRSFKDVVDLGTAATAVDKMQGMSNDQALGTAVEYIIQHNNYDDISGWLYSPPAHGSYQGNSRYIEIEVWRNIDTHFIHLLNGKSTTRIRVRSIAGYEEVTAGVALMILEPQPLTVQISPVSPEYAGLTLGADGLEVTGSHLKIDGAIVVNTEWGGVDKDWTAVGIAPGPPYAITCPSTHLHALDVRAVGGVDNPDKYRMRNSGGELPVEANRLSIPDPWEDLSVPSAGADATPYGGVSAAEDDQDQGEDDEFGADNDDDDVKLDPGTYDWIEVLDGNVLFNPGIYIIQSVNPDTGLALFITEDNVIADGVLFYITNSGAPLLSTPVMTPSAVFVVHSGSYFSGLDDSSSPFDGMLVYQSRDDHRPILVRQLGTSNRTFSGHVYSKSGSVVLGGTGTIAATFTVGSMKVINDGSLTITPADLLPPAQDVFLVE